MLTQRLFVWSSIPVAFISMIKPLNLKGYKVAMWIHICLSLTAWGIYLYLRYTYSFNKIDPSDGFTRHCVEYDHKGCRVLEYMPPYPPKRRILVFPGLMISVRRMIREKCITPFLQDSIIICFQIRGLGDSELLVDLSTETISEDAISQYLNFEIRTNAQPTFFIAYSLGSFTAMQLQANIRIPVVCNKLILVNGLFECEYMYPMFKCLTKILGISNKELLSKSNVPILVVHAKNDKTVEPKESINLIKECRSQNPPRHVEYLFIDGDHSDYVFSSEQKVEYARSLNI